MDFITDDYAKQICKVGQGADCCRYLCMSPEGWSCEKFGSFSDLLDFRVLTGTINARGDNCAGKLSR